MGEQFELNFIKYYNITAIRSFYITFICFNMKPFPFHPHAFSLPRLLISKLLEDFHTSINLKELHAKFLEYKYFLYPIYLQIKKHDTYIWNQDIAK